MLKAACFMAGLSIAGALPLQAQDVVEVRVRPARAAHQKGKLDWFEGSWEELLAQAAKSEQLVFLDFWTDWCGYCKKLDKVTFTAEAVVDEMADILCFSVDAESRRGSSLARKFRVRGYPALIFLESDGSERDRLSGFFPPIEFVAQVQRIKRDEDTLGGLRKKVENHPSDLVARYALALKLKAIGEVAGYRTQIGAIKKLDPQATSFPARRIKLEETLNKVKSNLDLSPLYTFLESETESELLFDGWYTIWKFEEHLADQAKEGNDEHRHRWLSAARNLWPHVPEQYDARLGNEIAWSFYVNRDLLDKNDMAFALKVGQKAAAAAPEEAAVIDTLACCLFAVGRRDEALEFVERCIELEPSNPEWRKRLQEFLR